MASELLKTFEKIENARQRGITILKRLGYGVNDNSSLGTIHEYLNFLPNDNSNLVLPVDVITDPEVDPAIWREPSDWPDICEILSEAEDIGMYTPCAIALLDNTVDETQIVTGVTSSTDLSTFKYSTQFRSKCVTSDGVTYDLLGDNYTHVWDSTKDINGKYRYLIFYMETERVPSNSWFYPQRLNAVAMACNQFMYASSYNYGNPISNSNSNIGGYKCQAVYLINPKTQLGIDYYADCDARGHNGVATIIGSNTSYDNPLRKVVIEKPIVNTTNYTTRWGFSGQGQLYRGLNYLEDNRDPRLATISSDGANALVYYKGPLNLIRGNTNTARYRLKYVYITDADDITELPDYAFRNCYSIITDIVTPFKNVTKIGNLAYMCCGLDFNKIIAFPKVTEFRGTLLNYVSAQIISFPSLKTIPESPFAATHCNILLLESLESLSSLGGVYDLIEIYAPNLKEATGSALVSSTSSIRQPLTIDFSSLETLQNAKYFQNNTNLRNLILKQDFKFNLNLGSCTLLTRECALDLINKCAQLDELESYTLTFYGTVYHSLTEEERAIATNKGWTVAAY